jgi:hypothetical protein
MSNTARDPADPIDPPTDDNAARDRRVLLDLIDEFRADHAIVVANLKAENWRLIQKAERDKPPEMWWLLKAVIAVDWDRPTERQEKTDHERMRRWCATGVVVAERRGPGNGRWWVRMQEDPDGHMTPMLRK